MSAYADYLKHYNQNHDRLGRFTFSKGDADRLIRLERDDPTEFSRQVNSYDSVKQFKNENTGKIRKAISDYAEARDKLNRAANDAGRKAANMSANEKFTDLVQRKDIARMDAYLSAGKNFAQSDAGVKIIEKPYRELVNQRVDYEKKTRDFVNKFLGEYGNIKVENTMSLKYNAKEGTTDRQTLSDRVWYEIYREFS